VLRRIFGSKWEEVAIGWRRLRNEELHNLYSSSSIIQVMKPRGMRCSKHVAGWERQEMYTKFWLGNLKGRNHLEDIGVDGKIILELMLGK
jgi:hypothetical protein